MPYKVSFDGEPNQRFSFSDGDMKVSLGSGESVKVEKKPPEGIEEAKGVTVERIGASKKEKAAAKPKTSAAAKAKKKKKKGGK